MQRDRVQSQPTRPEHQSTIEQVPSVLLGEQARLVRARTRVLHRNLLDKDRLKDLQEKVFQRIVRQSVIPNPYHLLQLSSVLLNLPEKTYLRKELW
jgi:hypothetical protein